MLAGSMAASRRRAQLFADLLAGKALCVPAPMSTTAAARSRARAKKRALRIVAVLQPLRPRASASQASRKSANRSGPAQGVAAFERLEHRGGAQLEGAMHVGVVTRGDHRQLAQVVRHAQPRGELLDQRDAGVLVPVM